MSGSMRTGRSTRGPWTCSRRPCSGAPLPAALSPWTFVFADDPAMIDGLARSKAVGSAFLKGAPLAVVVCGDESKSDVWVEDCSIAAIVAHLTAHSLGLGSCWVQIRNREHSAGRTAESFIQELLGLPATLRVEAIVAIGYPAESPSPHPADKLDYSRIRHNHY